MNTNIKPEKVTFDPPTLERFKIVYAKHADNPDAVFVFDGREYLVGYAKYLIQYLEFVFYHKPL